MEELKEAQGMKGKIVVNQEERSFVCAEPTTRESSVGCEINQTDEMLDRGDSFLPFFLHSSLLVF